MDTNQAKNVVNKFDLQNMNRGRIMQLVYKNPGITRAQISSYTGLTGAAISKITNKLIELDLLKSVGRVSGKMGRKAEGLEVNVSEFNVLAIKLSRRELRIGIFSLSSELISQKVIDISKLKPDTELVELISSKILEYVNSDKKIAAVGIAVPGPFDNEANKIIGLTDLDSFSEVNLSGLLELDIDVPVYLIHDANSGVMAEWLTSEDLYAENKTIAYYLVGDGVGAGIISDGKMLLGKNGTAAEVGHISINFDGEKCRCGNYGCLELYCSSLQFVRKAEQLLHKFPNSALNFIKNFKAQDIFENAAKGDDLCVSLAKEVAEYMGYGVVNLVNAYAPDEIIIGDVMSNGGDLVLDKIRSVVSERAFNGNEEHVIIRYADKSVDRILLGAASVAIDNLLRNTHLLSQIINN